VSEDFTTDYFKSAAGAATARLIEEGRLNKLDSIRYLVLAFFDESHAQAGPIPQFTTREIPPDITLVQSPMSDFIGASTPFLPSAGESSPDDATVPILIPRRLLDEARELAVRAGDNETGGILIGHLHRDASLPELFVEITAQIPAEHAPAEVNRLTFTPETWTAAQAAVDLRRSEEVFLGWWHYHVIKEICRNCPDEKKIACQWAHGFLSEDDRLLHRTVFPRAYTCALVVSDIADGHDVAFSLFGWRRGILEARGFHVTDDVDDSRGRATDTAATSTSENP
jgi:hypothetical protein